MSFSSRSTNNIKVFFAYSQHRQDQGLRKDLEDHLHELRSLGVDSKWHKYQIQTEREWEDEIYEDINTADLIVILVSPYFLNESSWNAPVERAKKRCEHQEIPLIPVLLRQVNGWERKLGDLAPLPSNGIAIASSPNRDTAFVEVAQGIVEKVEELKQYQEKLQEYEQHFSEAIQREEPLSEYAREWLNNFKHTWNIKDKDIVRIEELVTQKQQELYNNNFQQYKQRWYAETQREYPISDSTRDELKSLQKSLKLKDEDIARIEEQIPQSRRSEIYLTEIPKISGGGIAAIVIVAIVVISAMNNQDKPPSKLPSLASNQIESPAIKTNYENFDGWIFIGQVKRTSYSPNVKKPLISASRSIDLPFVPWKGNKVTVIKHVSLRQNRPQKPNFNHEEVPLLGAIEKGKKVMIVDTFIVPSTSTFTAVWAKVRKCDVACN
ncbi:MAG: TIR domain-containing protein [Potamolinea sp.]